jgi:Mg-chelatase subunit ChlI
VTTHLSPGCTGLHRYVEKLATPDVSIADLIGDVDPIKAAATLKLPYADERVLHYGLIPRSHRCIFVINEIPDSTSKDSGFAVQYSSGRRPPDQRI